MRLVDASRCDPAPAPWPAADEVFFRGVRIAQGKVRHVRAVAGDIYVLLGVQVARAFAAIQRQVAVAGPPACIVLVVVLLVVTVVAVVVVVMLVVMTNAVLTVVVVAVVMVILCCSQLCVRGNLFLRRGAGRELPRLGGGAPIRERQVRICGTPHAVRAAWGPQQCRDDAVHIRLLAQHCKMLRDR